MRRLAVITARWWWTVIAAWGLLAAAALLLTPPFTDVATFDDTAFLPPGSSALRGAELVRSGWPDDNFTNTSVLALVRDDRGLTEDDRAYARAQVDWLRSPEAPAAFGQVTTHLEDPALAPVLAADDGQAMIIVAGLTEPPFSPAVADAVTGWRQHVAAQPPPEGLEALVTGAAALSVDEDVAVETSLARTQWLTVALVLALLLWVFRAPLAALVPLVTVGVAYVVGLGVVSLLAHAGMDVSYLFQFFAIVIVFGAGTDYSLLILSRYEEELRATPDTVSGGRAMRLGTLVATMTVLAGVLASSAGTTVVGFSAQAIAKFGLFRTIGPALAIAVAITLLVGLTLTPALVSALGRWLLWPRTAGGSRGVSR